MSKELEMQPLINLKTKLQFLKFIWLLPCICILIFLRIQLLETSVYQSGDRTITGTVIDIIESQEKTTFVMKAKEKIQVSDYEKHPVKLGDQVQVTGTLKEPENTRVFHTFQYANYLKSKRIMWLCTAKEVTVVKENTSWFYAFKHQLRSYLKKQNHYPYLFAFILGDTSYLEEEKDRFQTLGISHLFAISGTQVSIIAIILTNILNKPCSKKLSFFFVSLFLIFYMILTGLSPSIMRATFMYILLPIVPISTPTLLVILAVLLLCYNPFYLYHLGFVFSFVISFYLLLFQAEINKRKQYLGKLFQISLIAFFASIPILLYHFHELNIMTLFYNILFVPYVTFLLFPVTVLCFIFPVCNPVLTFIIQFFHLLMDIATQFSCVISFPHVPLFFYGLECLFVFLFLKSYYQKKCISILLICLFFCFHSFYMELFGKSSITMIDVGQGDSILIQLAHNKGAILIDTGGITSFGEEQQPFLVETRILPYLKSLGIKKLDYLVLSHGDYDHMGEAKELIRKIPVKQIVMNSGVDNKLEKAIQIQAKKKKIPIIKMSRGILSLDHIKFYFLNSKNSQNENQDSLICYTKIEDRNILLLGDASKEEEQQLFYEYQFPKMDILKIGHHGSNTSTSNILLEKLNPTFALISVGTNNLYHHPSQEVIQTLSENNIKTFQTKDVGSIKIELYSMRVTSFLP